MSDTPLVDSKEFNAHWPISWRRDEQGMVVDSSVAKQLEREVIQLREWKRQQLLVESWWKEIDDFIRNHKDSMLGDSVANNAIKFLKERDTIKTEMVPYKAIVESLRKMDLIYHLSERRDQGYLTAGFADWQEFTDALETLGIK